MHQQKIKNNTSDINIVTFNAFLKILNQQFFLHQFLLEFILLFLFDIFIVHKVVELFSCIFCIESFNFVSLLDRIFMQQSSKNISTKPHTHQNIKNIKNIIKTSQKHHFNILKFSLNAN